VGEADIAAVTEEEPVAKFPTEQIADVVADNGTRCGGDNDTRNMQILVAPGIQGGNDERRLTRDGPSYGYGPSFGFRFGGGPRAFPSRAPMNAQDLARKPAGQPAGFARNRSFTR
jgi:hypothetical protein